MEVTLNGAKILYVIENVPLLGDFKITQTLVVTWLVMALTAVLAWWLGRNLQVENISKRQAAAEFIVEALDNFVRGNMGTKFDCYIPLVGAIFSLSILCNLISVLGLWSPTADLNTELAWAVVVFILITYHKLKASGILGYLRGFLDPIFILAPINVMSECFTPISMSFRHFGNILSGMVISTLIYAALSVAGSALLGLLGGSLVVDVLVLAAGAALLYRGLTKSPKKEGAKRGSLPGKIFGVVLLALGVLGAVSNLPAVGGLVARFPWLDVGVPALTGLYFDWFGGCIQAFIFCTLTTLFIKQAAGDD